MPDLLHRHAMTVAGLWLAFSAWGQTEGGPGGPPGVRPVTALIAPALLVPRGPHEAPVTVADPFDTPPPMIPAGGTLPVVSGPPPEAPFLVLEAVLLTRTGGSARLAGRNVALGEVIPGIEPDEPPVLIGLESTMATVAWRERVYVLELGARPREVAPEEDL